jgi:hypothetical protein
MLKIEFTDNRFSLIMSLDIFHYLWDDTYADLGNYDVSKFREQLEIDDDYIDLDSFVSDQALGDEFEEDGHDAYGCQIDKFEDNNIYISGFVGEI